MDGRYVGIVDVISSVLNGSITQSEVAWLKGRLANPPANCIFDNRNYRFVAYDDMFGRRLARVVRDLPSEVQTGWYDPELGCERLQSTIESKQPGGSLAMLSKTVPVALNVGEPDDRLFSAPLSYSVVASVKELEEKFGTAAKANGVPTSKPQ
ncbi:MAG TPA: hypothetical protein VF135_12875 [Terriglobales bacterium]